MRTVRWQQVDSPEAVEAPLGEIPGPPSPGWVRRWLWLPALLACVGVAVVQRTVDSPSADLEMWLMLAFLATLMLTAVAALVRYRDDQRLRQEQRGVEALRADARTTTGTTTVVEREISTGTMLTGTLSHSTDDGIAETTWTLLVAPGDAPGPRPGDPVAVWWAPGNDVVVARYHRGWAEQVRGEHL